MRKFLLLMIVCVTGMVMPQRLLADEIYNHDGLKIETSDGGETVIITSNSAGKLSGAKFNSNPEAIQAISNATGKIVFSGQFNQDDLERLTNVKVHGTNYNCCTQTTVDMSGAQFTSYSAMSFKYWATTLEHAITSNYADNTVGDDIFSGCNSLQTVDYKSGVVKGLNDKSSLVSVNFGKNVTSIYNGAFQRSSVQTVTFDKDYQEGDTPLNLTIGQDAFQDCNNLTGIEFPNRVTSIGSSAFKGAGTSATEFAVSFERRFKTDDPNVSVNYDVNLTIGESAFQGCTTIKTLSLPIRLTTIGNNVFAGTTNLTTVEIREDVQDARLTTIPPGAFLDSGITSITIPRSITLIEEGAFQECFNLETITFQESLQTPQPDLVIKTRAFAGGDEHKYKLKDVYVDINPQTRRLICEYDAFNFTSLVGQTDVTSGQMATLHFSEGYWDYYAGDWKKGVTFTQTALNSFKDGCDPTKNALTGESMNDGTKKGSNQDIHSNAGRIPGMSPGNGWHQFAVTSTGIDVIIPKGRFFRTYSTDKAQVRPEWMTIYRITAFTDGFIEGESNASSQQEADNATKAATATEIKTSDTGNFSLIPAKTGVIRVDEVEKDALYYFMDWKDTHQSYSTDWEYEYLESGDKVNFMEPTGDAGAEIGPVVKDGNTITHRIFGLLKTGEFSRAKPMTMAANRAYLKLPASLFHWQDEKTHSSQDATEGAVVSNNSKISMVFDFGFDEEINGIATEIIKAIEEDMYKNDSFYTLQGVKVAKPIAKGVYIRNGKKVLIK